MTTTDTDRQLAELPAPGTSPDTKIPEDPQARRKLIEALREGWLKEIESMTAYRELAKVEPDHDRRDILNRLADTEEKHAHALQDRLVVMGSTVPELPSGWRGKVKTWLLRQGGLDAAVNRLEAEEDKAAARYETQAVESGDTEFQEVLHHMELEEEAHSRVLRTMTRAAELATRWISCSNESAGTRATRAGSEMPSMERTMGWEPFSASCPASREQQQATSR